MRRSGRRRRWLVAGLAAAAGLPAVLGGVAGSQEASPAPNIFSIRLEGFAVEVNTFSTATAVTPRTGYSFAKLNSVLDLDGGRGLDMEARGANTQDAGLAGVVLFSGGDVPTNGNNLPGYTQAFFPTFEGFEQISEKCAFNQTEAKETPECRDQPGAYALSRVVPDQERPVVEGIGRSESEGEGADASSRSAIEPQPDGSVRGVQSNRGSNQGVPGTPIMVDSYVAEQTIETSIGEAGTQIRCAGNVSVGGQAITDNEQLQQALAPLTLASDLRVTYEPPTEPTVKELTGGALEASCRGPRFIVFTGVQGGTGTTYTFGSTFAAAGVTQDDLGLAPPVGGAIGDLGPVTPDLPEPPTATGSATPDGSFSSGATRDNGATPSGDAPAPEATTDGSGGDELAGGGGLVRRSIDATPVGVWTGAAAALLPLGIWLLLGVTGSLARGLPSLRLPPFPE